MKEKKTRTMKHFSILDIRGDQIGCVEVTSEKILDGVRHAVEQGGSSLERSDRSLCEFCLRDRAD